MLNWLSRPSAPRKFNCPLEYWIKYYLSFVERSCEAKWGACSFPHSTLLHLNSVLFPRVPGLSSSMGCRPPLLPVASQRRAGPPRLSETCQGNGAARRPRKDFRSTRGTGTESKRNGIPMSGFSADKGQNLLLEQKGSPEAGSTGGSRPSRSPRGGVVGSGCEGRGAVHAWGVPHLRSCREGRGMILVVGTECVHSEKTGGRGGGARARLEG